MIGELMEVILYVEDMNKQVGFYRDVLGFAVEYPEGLDDYGKEFWVTMRTGACVLALHAGGQKRFGVDAPKIVFRVADVPKARQLLADKGVEIGEVRSAAPGVWVADAKDAEGNSFSIEAHEN
jgi:predicted enzyme related to lactoylglutathione lyase